MKASGYTKRVQGQLRAIVALLLALAGLAERAAGRSAPVRILALWFLRRGEIAARDYVMGLTGRVVPAPAPARLADAGDALLLAKAFRVLAAALLAFVTAAAMCRRAEIGRAVAAMAGAPAEETAGRPRFIERLDSS